MVKYVTEVIIDKPRDEVIALLEDPKNMVHWMPGLKSYDFLSGEPGAVGSKMVQRFDMGKRQIEMVETILVSDFPETWSAEYDSGHGRMMIHNTFTEMPGGRTHWRGDNEFICDAFFMKIMSRLMPGMFRKESQKYLNSFKAFAEGQ